MELEEMVTANRIRFGGLLPGLKTEDGEVLGSISIRRCIRQA